MITDTQIRDGHLNQIAIMAEWDWAGVSADEMVRALDRVADGYAEASTSSNPRAFVAHDAMRREARCYPD